MKKKISIFLCVCLISLLFGCGQQEESKTETVKLNIAYQYGLAYAPLIVAQQQNLIEQVYKEKTGKDLEITWSQLSSGADINTGIASGNIDVGFMGVAPAITGVSKHVGYKIFTSLSGQEHSIMVNDDSIESLDDLVGSDYQVAVVNIGSIQHILLAKTLVANGYDAHALDANLIAMKHTDGMIALETGSVTAHVTTNPYIFQEREKEGLHEIGNMPEVCSVNDSFIVGVASDQLYNEDAELYEALCEGIESAVQYINDDIEGAAEITCVYNGNSVDDEIIYLKEGSYTVETQGITALAHFMYENGFIENDPGDYSDLVFDNVKGN